MEKGYYKPEIEEFCIGLQIEVFQPALNKYHLCPFTEKCNFYEYNIDLCRVKLLDREDIESCGFDHDQTTKDGAYFYKGTLMDQCQWMLTAENAMERKGGDSTWIDLSYDEAFKKIFKNK